MHYFVFRQYRTGEIERFETSSLFIALVKLIFTRANDVRLIKALM